MIPKDKASPLYFYKLNVGAHGTLPQAKKDLCKFFEKHSGKKAPTPDKIIGDYEIQLQGIVECKERESVVGGVVKKFMDSNHLKKGVVGTAAEKKIKLDKGELIILKTYFLYDLSNHILVYQFNQYGTLCNRFGEYLETQCSPPLDIEFDFILTRESYHQVLQDKPNLKEIDLRISPPTAIALLRVIKNPWAKDLLTTVIRSRGEFTFKLNAKVKYGNKHLENKEGIYELLKEFYKLLRGTLDTSDMKAKLKVVDINNLVHPIDLVMDRLSDTVNILKGGYPIEDNDIIAGMEDAFIRKQDELNEVLGGMK